ncbi:MAG: FAD-binding protein [Pseudomonadota bacterium]
MSVDNYPVINAAEVSEWHHEADVVVVGFGAGGSCAALGACEQDASVLVLERGSGVSGTSTIASGHFYLGGGTRPQLANGIEDSADEMFKYLMANTPEPDEHKIRLYCDQSVDHFNWLCSHGLPFNDGFYKKKHYEQPTDECLIWSGNEKVWPISEQAKPAPRGHKIEKEGTEAGSLAMKHLTASAEDKGVAFEFDANVKHLIVDDQMQVVGACYSHFGDMKYVKANKGVVLAAGGFAMNADMVNEYCPTFGHKAIYKQGNPNDDGGGINLGLSVGGEALHMDRFLVTAPFYPPENMLKAILVNKHGKRFINEDSYHARTASACIEQPDHEVYLICDNSIFERPSLGMQELIDGWETVEEMEKDLGLPEGELQATIREYNKFAEFGKDPDQNKHKDWVQPLNTPPYAALQATLGPSMYVGFTLGGLKVSADGEVLQKGSDQPVKGLYAAGACASNIAQDGAGYSSGTCLGEATFFGRRSGRHAASL